MTPRPAQQPRIVWDLDDTLNELMRGWLNWHCARQVPPRAVPAFGELVENPPHRLLGLALEEYQESLDRFRLSHEASALAPPPAVLAWFQRHGFDFEHHLLTARPAATVAPAAEWVFRHFGRWIRHFHFVPSFRSAARLPDQGITKRDIIQQLAPVDFVVDDSAETLDAARDVARFCLLAPQPWNHGRGTIADVLPLLTSTEK